MSKQIVYSGQNFFNKVIECTGNVDNAFEMLLKNNQKSFTQNLIIGQELKTTPITNVNVVNYFNEMNRPATAKNKLNINSQIGYEFPYEFPLSF